MNPKSILPIVISVLFYQTNVPISEKSRVLTLCVEKFGRPIDEQKHLFEINRFYLLRVEFERTGRLKLLAVEPKYFFQESHPEWSEPEEFSFLSKDEFDKLLMVLDQIRSRGQLLESCPISLMTNLTAPRTDIYQHATVVRGSYWIFAAPKMLRSRFVGLELNSAGRNELRVARKFFPQNQGLAWNRC